MFRKSKIWAAAIMAMVLVFMSTSAPAAAGVTRRTILPGTKLATELVEYDSGVPGPTVWISGGVHGSELAGWQAAQQIARWTVAKGRLIVVPHANQPAVSQRKRFPTGGTDLNRQFPEKTGQKPKGSLATALWQELQRYKPDWVFDLHEAMGNRNNSKDSVGQTFIVHPRAAMTTLANQAVKKLNTSLTAKKKFQVIRNPVHGSLAWAAGAVLGANATIVETSRLYPLADRVQWHLKLMRYVLEGLDMQPKTAALDTGAGALAEGSLGDGPGGVAA